MPEVRLIDENGNQVGVMRTPEALRYAQDKDLDLVEVAPEARPPVCRVLDYSKYKYEQAQKVKQARKHQQQITIREIKFRPKIAENDYNTKKGHVERFLRHKDKVKITIMFRGREVTHPERGVMILDRLAEELAELAVIEQRPIQDGRNMTMMLGPSKAVLSGEINAGGETAAGGDAERVAEVEGETGATQAGEAVATAAPDAEAETAVPEAEAEIAAPEAGAETTAPEAETAEAAPAAKPAPKRRAKPKPKTAAVAEPEVVTETTSTENGATAEADTSKI